MNSMVILIKHKNFVIEQCEGDYIFHIDADEYPNSILLKQVKDILKINQVDLIWVPRVNTVDGITEEHIRQWGWKVTEQGWVNYPDYQSRIFKNHESIRWDVNQYTNRYKVVKHTHIYHHMRS